MIDRTKEMGPTNLGVAVCLLICFAITGVLSSASDHRYKAGEPVPLYANKVGPFHNPR
jgi:transmembrane 9 superfamily member 1